MQVKHLTVLFASVLFANGYNILAVFPHEGKSHLWIFRPIINALVQKNHNVTVIMHHGFEIDHGGNYREILLDNPASKRIIGMSFDRLQYQPIKYIERCASEILFQEGLISCEFMLTNEEVKSFIKSNEKFDLIISEIFNTECVQGFVHKFQAPLVGISTTMLLTWHTDRFANPENPSFVPTVGLPHGDKMSLIQKVENFLDNIHLKSVYYSYLEANKAIIEKHFERRIPDLMEMMRNTSLLLVNSHFTLGFPRPLVPAVVDIGGIHVPSAVEKLPENIEKFINESTHGVIYFSLGSMIKGHTFPQEKREEFLKAFARLPQRVLWKWENETMPGKPDNVMIQKWMPQFDILSHPNVKAFISHGGLLGTTEAVHCGVPMLVMPQYGDQHTNAKAVEANGGGVILYLKEATEEKVYQSLKTILDPEFRGKTKALSERFRDRPMSPMDTAVYWVEYVARHKGAPHMRTAAVDMPLYQYLLLDVIGFLAVVLLTFLYITYKILSLILRALFSKKKVKQN